MIIKCVVKARKVKGILNVNAKISQYPFLPGNYVTEAQGIKVELTKEQYDTIKPDRALEITVIEEKRVETKKSLKYGREV